MFKSLLLSGRTLCLLICCMISSLVVTAQTKHSGKVIGGDDKQPVIGASVVIKGTNTGAVTDVNGDFTLSLKSGDVLVVSYIGYQTQEVPVTGSGFVTVTLQPTSTSLNEVVVTGYQTQVKKDITGAVATVDMSAAKKIPAGTSEQLLQGQASGVNVINQGLPGASSTVFIRGISNFGNSQPLYVIDGVQTNSMSFVNPNDIESISVLKDAGSAAIYGVAGGNGVIIITTKKGKAGKSTISYDGYYGDQAPLSGNVWHLMNPTQQSQLAFMAGDAGQQSLYPGGAGVLPTYGYHGSSAPSGAGAAFGAAGVTNDPSITKYYNFDAANPGNDFLVQKFNQQGTDWFHEIFKHAPEQSHTITASGGNDHDTHLYSLQYLNQQGTLLESFEKRYQVRLNNTFSLFNNHFRFGENGWVYYRQNRDGYTGNQQNEGGSISETYREMPIIPVYDIAGNYGGGYDGPSGEPLSNASNPVAMQQRTMNDLYQQTNVQGSLYAEADLMKHFTLRTEFGGDLSNDFNHYAGYNTYENYESHTNPNSYAETASYSYAYNWTNTLSYKQIFGKHSISAFAGYEIRQNGGQQVGGYATNFVTLDPNFVTIAATTAPTSIALGGYTYLFQPTGTESYFGRADYSYADKYLLSATIRRDGYSSFYPGHQWGTFPAVTLGWRVSQEDFLKNVSWLQELKLRGSYGEGGNNANILGTNAYDTYNYGFGSTSYGINGGLNSVSTGYALQSIGNPYTSWENDKILNIGADISAFNRLDMSVEYYRKESSGLLFPISLPAVAGGASAPTINVGNVQNTGVDISATYHDVIGQNFKFSIGANITTLNNKITKLNVGQQYFDIFGGSRIGSFVREAVGMPIGEFYGYQVQGIYQSDSQAGYDRANNSNSATSAYSGAQAGSYIYKDMNGDGKINDADKTFLGNPNPNFVYGVNLNASYKRFDFSMVLYGSQGNKDFNYVKYWTDMYHSFPGGKDINLLTNSAIVKNGVVTNPSATQTAITDGSTMGTTIPSSFYVENGSFLKCRVASIGYTLDPGLLQKIGVSRVHVYVEATNLFTITKYSGLDPELVPSVSNLGSGSNASASTGVDWGAYPTNQRTILLGMNLTF